MPAERADNGGREAAIAARKLDWIGQSGPYNDHVLAAFLLAIPLLGQVSDEPYRPGTEVKLGDGLYRRELLTGEKSGDLLAKLREVSLRHRIATGEGERASLEDSMRWLWVLYRKAKVSGGIITVPRGTRLKVIKRLKARSDAGGNDYVVRITSGKLSGRSLRWNPDWMDYPLLLEKCYVKEGAAFAFSEYALRIAEEAEDSRDVAVLRGLLATERIVPLREKTLIQLIGWTEDVKVSRYLVLDGHHRGKKLFGQEYNVSVYKP